MTPETWALILHENLRAKAEWNLEFLRLYHEHPDQLLQEDEVNGTTKS